MKTRCVKYKNIIYINICKHMQTYATRQYWTMHKYIDFIGVYICLL